MDVARAGLAGLADAEIDVTTDSAVEITLDAVPHDTTVHLGAEPADPTVSLQAGRHRIVLAR